MVSCLMGDSTALASAIVRCCLKKSRQQVSLDIPDLGCVPVDTVEHILNVHGAYFKQTAPYDLAGELVSGNTDIRSF